MTERLLGGYGRRQRQGLPAIVQITSRSEGRHRHDSSRECGRLEIRRRDLSEVATNAHEVDGPAREPAGYATIGIMKKQMVVAFALVLLIPVVIMAGGFLFSLINPEIAAGHPNYVRNYHVISRAKIMVLWGSWAVAAILWVVACLLVIRSKERSWVWVVLAALGPVGFAILATLNDREPGEMDRYTRFVRSLNWLMRIGYEVCRFVILWLLAYQAMVLKRNVMILYQSFTTGMSTAQIIDIQNASSGMWAFAEGMEVMFLVVLFYLMWPAVFNVAGRMVATFAAPKAR